MSKSFLGKHGFQLLFLPCPEFQHHRDGKQGGDDRKPIGADLGGRRRPRSPEDRWRSERNMHRDRERKISRPIPTRNRRPPSRTNAASGVGRRGRLGNRPARSPGRCGKGEAGCRTTTPPTPSRESSSCRERAGRTGFCSRDASTKTGQTRPVKTPRGPGRDTGRTALCWPCHLPLLRPKVPGEHGRGEAGGSPGP